MKQQALFVLLFLISVLFIAADRQNAFANSRSYEEVFGRAYSNHDNFSREMDGGARTHLENLGSVSQNSPAGNR